MMAVRSTWAAGVSFTRALTVSGMGWNDRPGKGRLLWTVEVRVLPGLFQALDSVIVVDDASQRGMAFFSRQTGEEEGVDELVDESTLPKRVARVLQPPVSQHIKRVLQSGLAHGRTPFYYVGSGKIARNQPLVQPRMRLTCAVPSTKPPSPSSRAAGVS